MAKEEKRGISTLGQEKGKKNINPPPPPRATHTLPKPIKEKERAGKPKILRICTVNP